MKPPEIIDPDLRAGELPQGHQRRKMVAIASASKASKNVATPTMIRVLTCHHEVGSRSMRATTLSTPPAAVAEPMLMPPSPVLPLFE